jgi:tetratricopeptide (TPR) repeat protein
MRNSTQTHHATKPENLQQLLQDAWARLETQPQEALVPARRAECLARRVGDNRAWAHSLFIWGVTSLYSGNTHEAIALFSRALAVYRFLGDEQGQWSCLKAIALCWGFTGDAAQAQETHSQADAFLRQAEYASQARWLDWFCSI